MNPKNKQRIIGVVILVAFVALLIPFLFTSGIGKKITNYDQIPMNPEQRQLATKQIETTSDIVIPPKQPETPIASNQQTLAASEPEVSAAVVAENQTNSSIATSERSSDVSLPPELSGSNQTPLPPLPTLQNDAELAVKTPETTATTTPEPETVTTEEPLQPQKKIDEALLMDKMIKKSAGTKIKTQNKIETAPVVVNKKNTNSTKKTNIKKVAIKKTGNWSIQVGSFTNSLGVNKLVNQLRNKGFKAYLQKVTKNGVVMTRVLVGSEADKHAAKQIADKLSADLNIIGHLVRS